MKELLGKIRTPPPNKLNGPSALDVDRAGLQRETSQRWAFVGLGFRV